MTLKKTDDGLISTDAAATLLRITVAQFTRIATNRGWLPDGEYVNPHHRSGPRGKLWARKKIVARSRLKIVTEARTRKGGLAPRDYACVFATRYKRPEAALPDACEALFNLNRYTRHSTCSDGHRAEILDLKSALIAHLYRAEIYTDRVEKLVKQLPAQECNRCDGDGCERCNETGVWREERTVARYVFTFTIHKQRYTWVQPDFALSFTPKVEATRQDDGERPELDKTINIPRSKLGEAKALIKYALSCDRLAQEELRRAALERAELRLHQ